MLNKNFIFRIIKNLLLFQKRIFFISILLSIFISLFFGFKPISIAFGYLFVSPIAHFFVYELHNDPEYYFYYNVGLSKQILWFSTFAIGFLLLFLIALL